MINVQSVFDTTVEYFMNAPLISGAIANPLLCALMLVIGILVIYNMSADDSTNGTIRGGFYSLLFATVIVFLNNKKIMSEAKTVGAFDDLGDIQYDEGADSGIIPVEINTSGL